MNRETVPGEEVGAMTSQLVSGLKGTTGLAVITGLDRMSSRPA